LFLLRQFKSYSISENKRVEINSTKIKEVTRTLLIATLAKKCWEGDRTYDL